MSNNSPLIIIGHRNPDTDAIASALVYASLKRKLGIKAEAKRIGALNNETKFVLSFLNQEPPELIRDISGKEVILVDHGDISQAIDGLKIEQIVEVIDHHYIGLKTEKRIYYRAEPLGCTCTILAKLFKEKDVGISKDEAGLMLSAIISDTLLFHSPTTTKQDKEIAKNLSLISGIDMQELADKMFDAKSDLSGFSVDDVVSIDAKEFEFNGIKFGISVFETIRPEKVRAFGPDIFKSLEGLKREKGQKFSFFLIVDILKQCSFLYLLQSGEEEIAQSAFSGEIKDNIMFLPGVVSRKKQVFPLLLEVMKNLNKEN